MVMKIEYIILIILALGFYQVTVKDYIEKKKNKNFINDNLEEGAKIITFSGIIGEVSKIDGEIITILSGDRDSFSTLNIKKSEIKNIIS